MAELFSWEGLYLAQVTDVYDGDTITICMNPFPGSKYSSESLFKVRMYGYDSPEMKPPRSNPEEVRAVIKHKAVEARDFLRGLVMDKYVVVQCLGLDRHSRLLCNIYSGDVSNVESEGSRITGGFDEGQFALVNELVLKAGHGYEYYGGKKKK